MLSKVIFPMGIVFIAAQLQKSLCEMYHHVAGWSVTKRQRHALASRMRKLHDYQSPSIQRQEPRWSHHFSWCAWAAAIGWKGVCLEGGGRRCKIWSWSGFCDGIDPLFTKTMVLSIVQEFQCICLCHICHSIPWQEFRGGRGWEFGSPTRH